jgi:hypothetical protein
MAEFTVDYVDYDEKIIGKLTVTLRGQGYEWKTTGTYLILEYHPKFHMNTMSLFLMSPRRISYFRQLFINPDNSRPIYFKTEDAMKIYNFFIEHIEWSPESIAAGTAHPNLMAAKRNFTSSRKTRKIRKQ